MTNREKLEKDIECMNKKGGKSADEWNMFLLTEIANLLAIVLSNTTRAKVQGL